ncbi:Protein of unknown function [Pyronema omphalodes CBS 100304]|uniref:Uncharacterized protein n=1 Tax=Pyronema omphalodes (strain CBS 100304) TaxID=1076935 RepID=U4LIJ6_PYROM|nr:Protein of unknown function [Pyronema omphalodes CBS 100304]
MPRYTPFLPQHRFPPAPLSASSPTTNTSKPTEASHQHHRMVSSTAAFQRSKRPLACQETGNNLKVLVGAKICNIMCSQGKRLSHPFN